VLDNQWCSNQNKGRITKHTIDNSKYININLPLALELIQLVTLKRIFTNYTVCSVTRSIEETVISKSKSMKAVILSIALLCGSGHVEAKPFTSSSGDSHRYGHDIAGHNGYAKESLPFGYLPKAGNGHHYKRTSPNTDNNALCTSNNADLDKFVCTSDMDCLAWDDKFGGKKIIDTKNPFNLNIASNRLICEANRCVPVQLGKEGDACVTGYDVYMQQ
jgi:hypothetical protein